MEEESKIMMDSSQIFTDEARNEENDPPNNNFVILQGDNLNLGSKYRTLGIDTDSDEQEYVSNFDKACKRFQNQNKIKANQVTSKDQAFKYRVIKTKVLIKEEGGGTKQSALHQQQLQHPKPDPPRVAETFPDRLNKWKEAIEHKKEIKHKL
jgi:hypothetical protein